MKVLLFLIIVIGIVHSQTTEVNADSISTNHAISFFILNELSLAYSYSFTPNSIGRANFRYSANYYEKEGTREDPSSSFLSDRYDFSNQQNFRLDLHYIYQIKPINPVILYLGFGPSLSYEYGADQITINDVIRLSSNQEIWKFGLSGILGVKGQIIDFLSIFAEYNASYLYTNDKYYLYSLSVKDSYEGYEFLLEDIKVGVSLHF